MGFPSDAPIVSGANERDGPLPPWFTSSLLSSEKTIHCCELSRPTTEEEWMKAKDALNLMSSGSYFSKTAKLHYLSPLKYVDVSVFRPYGFAIWEADRLEVLGFHPSCGRPRDATAERPFITESDCLFRWSSLLTKQQSEVLHRTQVEKGLFS